MVFANKATGIVHYQWCVFHPSEGNVEIYEELYHAVGDGYVECSYCYGNGIYWKDGKVPACKQGGVDCSFWENGCNWLLWYNDKAYCVKKYLANKKGDFYE